MDKLNSAKFLNGTLEYKASVIYRILKYSKPSDDYNDELLNRLALNIVNALFILTTYVESLNKHKIKLRDSLKQEICHDYYTYYGVIRDGKVVEIFEKMVEQINLYYIKKKTEYNLKDAFVKYRSYEFVYEFLEKEKKAAEEAEKQRKEAAEEAPPLPLSTLDMFNEKITMAEILNPKFISNNGDKPQAALGVLGISINDNNSRKNAYRKLAREYHPDRCSNDKFPNKDQCTTIFKHINWANDLLSSEEPAPEPPAAEAKKAATT
jgi:hypothetical protein